MAMKKAVRSRERRITQRAEARLSMRVEGAHDGAQAQIVTESQNVSSSGIYCLSSHYLPPLSKVQLAIVLPKIPGLTRKQEIVRCEGIVVRCDSASGSRPEPRYQLACMFAGLTPEERGWIEEFVTWRNLQALRAAVAPARTAKSKPATRKAGARTAAVARRKPARPAARRSSGARRAAR
jgi:hypothetical protein